MHLFFFFMLGCVIVLVIKALAGGKDTEEPKCPKCGRVAEGSKFCPGCGHKLVE